MTTRVAILGATGYSALELIKILLRHPQVRIAALTSRQSGSPHIASIHPSLTGRLDLQCEELSPSTLAERADCVFSCLPHGVTSKLVPQLLDAGLRVIDFSADYRLDSHAAYQEWYEEDHHDVDRLGQTVYGLPELFRQQIIDATLIANPGCYPTSAILALAPLLKAGLIEPRDIIIDSKSGVSGAGRSPGLTTHFPECNENFSAYKVGRHRHTPEIEQVLTRSVGRAVKVIFTPHLVPMDRGILSTIYSLPTAGVTEEQLGSALDAFYANEPFVRVVKHLPTTKDCSGSNYCDITVRLARGRVITISCLDNLIKGAAGAAVQSLNLMYGYQETTALQ